MADKALVLGLLLGLGVTAGARAQDATALFAEHCQACHQEGGVGSPGLAPPLVSPGIAGAAADYVPLVMLNGLSGRIEAGGEVYPGVMPRNDSLSDADIAAIATLVRGTFNGQPEPVTAAEVARLRAGGATDRQQLLALRKGAAQ